MGQTSFPYDAVFSVGDAQHDLGEPSNRLNNIYAAGLVEADVFQSDGNLKLKSAATNFATMFYHGSTLSYQAYATVFRPEQPSIDLGGLVNSQRWDNIYSNTATFVNDYTNASNFEKARIAFSGNVFEITTESEGTGVNRSMRINAEGSVFLQCGTGKNLQFYQGGSRKILMNSNTLYPNSAGLMDLGAGVAPFGTVYSEEVVVGNDTTPSVIKMFSPDGTEWTVEIDDTGNLTTT